MPYTLSFAIRHPRKGWLDVTQDIADLMERSADMSLTQAERDSARAKALVEATNADTVWLNGTLADEAEIRQAVDTVAKRYGRSSKHVQVRIDPTKKRFGIGIMLKPLGGLDPSTAP